MICSRRPIHLWHALAAGALLGTCAASMAAAPAAPTAAAATSRPANYVEATAIDYATLLPPAPAKGSALDESDRRIFLQTRHFKDTPRWLMAARDADAKTADMLQHFSCALDLELTATSAPQITKLAQNLSADAGRVAGSAKDFYKRDRPYLIDEGPTCRPREDTGKSFDYPSGHATAGWAWASALAQVATDRAVPILARGRAYGESRVVCGVHNMTAVEAARLATTGVALLAQNSAQYQADLAAARAEYAALKHSAPHPEAARCATEAALVALPLE